MKYANGKDVKLGDQIQIATAVFGEIVAVIEKGDFAASLLKKEWEYLQYGVLINSPQMGLVHETVFDEGVKLIRRIE